MKITLCGSTRFKEAYEYWNRLLSLAGHTVYSVSFYGHSEGINSVDKEIMDLVHLKKILDSDTIFVIDCPMAMDQTADSTYIGESTKREISWAYINDMRIFRASCVIRDPGANTTGFNLGPNLDPISELTSNWCNPF